MSGAKSVLRLVYKPQSPLPNGRLRIECNLYFNYPWDVMRTKVSYEARLPHLSECDGLVLVDIYPEDLCLKQQAENERVVWRELRIPEKSKGCDAMRPVELRGVLEIAAEVSISYGDCVVVLSQNELSYADMATVELLLPRYKEAG